MSCIKKEYSCRNQGNIEILCVNWHLGSKKYLIETASASTIYISAIRDTLTWHLYSYDVIKKYTLLYYIIKFSTDCIVCLPKPKDNYLLLTPLLHSHFIFRITNSIVDLFLCRERVQQQIHLSNKQCKS